ncbi:DUF397 domain-containing protein [Nocardiopsis sp. CNR-923]|uniref:DUF397 domain-containing protein n=1 Tax=Nocardiopsis sp. CNR-923 TaxID=1904965 RepID=UPI0009682741|nr:DUF397 domain-containing protein [Nocardiopsis sp. CNR-923]OLT24701.1 DUF397 domain-containing protein [Nocardiopsis sp. CNR-923]
MELTKEWRKSSYSGGNGGHCVEAKRTSDGAALRDTQNRALGRVETSPLEWGALLTALKGAAE